MANDSDFDLETFLPYRLNRAAELVSLRFAAEYKEKYGLTRPEWRTLAALGSSGRLTATEIGVHSAMHKTKVSRAVFSLEQRRWLMRTEDQRDRRSEHLELTVAGAQTYRELTALARNYQAELSILFGAANMEALATGLSAVEKSFAKSKRRSGE